MEASRKKAKATTWNTPAGPVEHAIRDTSMGGSIEEAIGNELYRCLRVALGQANVTPASQSSALRRLSSLSYWSEGDGVDSAIFFDFTASISWSNGKGLWTVGVCHPAKGNLKTVGRFGATDEMRDVSKDITEALNGLGNGVDR